MYNMYNFSQIIFHKQKYICNIVFNNAEEHIQHATSDAYELGDVSRKPEKRDWERREEISKNWLRDEPTKITGAVKKKFAECHKQRHGNRDQEVPGRESMTIIFQINLILN